MSSAAAAYRTGTVLPTLLQTGTGSVWPMQLLLFAVIFGIFYFIVFRPMRKRQRETEAMRRSLERGKQVITNGGIYGTIMAIHDEKIVLRVNENTRITVAKSAVASVVPKPRKG